jgi:hypothetical protein
MPYAPNAAPITPITSMYQSAQFIPGAFPGRTRSVDISPPYLQKRPNNRDRRDAQGYQKAIGGSVASHGRFAFFISVLPFVGGSMLRVHQVSSGRIKQCLMHRCVRSQIGYPILHGGESLREIRVALMQLPAITGRVARSIVAPGSTSACSFRAAGEWFRYSMN